MAESKKAEKKTADQEERKINPWVPIAVVVFIVALVAVMAVMGGGGDPATTGSDQTASGTVQSGDTAATDVDVSWITMDMTPNQVAEQAGIPAKMLMQVIGTDEAGMAKPIKDNGGDELLGTIQSLVAQFGGGGMGSTSGTDSSSGMMGGQ